MQNFRGASPPPADNRLPAIMFGRMSARVLGVLAVRGTTILATLAANVLVARVLGVEAFGVYSYAFAIVAVIGLPLNNGVPALVTRLVSTYRLQSKDDLVSGLLRRARQLAVAGGLLLAALSGVVIIGLGPAANLSPAGPFLISLAVLPLAALTAVHVAALSGGGRVVTGQACDLLARPLLLAALVWTAWQWRGGLGAPEAVLLRVFAYGAAALITIVLVRSLRTRPGAVPRFETRQWVRSALPLAFLGGLQVLTNRADLLMLGALEGSAAAGLYAPASQGAGLVVLGLVVLNAAIAPTIARFHAAGERERLQRLATWTARAACLWALPVAVGLAVGGGPILGWLYGADFAAGAPPLAILSLSQLVNAAVGSVSLLLTMTGHEAAAARGVLAAAVLNVVLNALLIPYFGPTGAATATAVSLITWNVLLTVEVRRRLHLDPTVAGRPPRRTQ